MQLREAFALRLINDGVLATTEGEGRIVLSYALREDYWCKGLAPEACRAMLRYGFEQLGLEEIGTSTRAENRAWRGMMEKLEMPLGELRCGDNGEEEVRYAASREEFLGASEEGVRRATDPRFVA